MAWAPGNTAFNFAAGSLGTIASSAYTSVVGNLIVASIRNDAAGRFTHTLTDSLGNDYYRIGPGADLGTASLGFVELWFCPASIGNGSNTLTATFNVNATNRGIVVMEFSGGLATPLQLLAASSNATGTTVTSRAFSTFTPNALCVWGADINTTGTTWTAGSGFTIGVQDGSQTGVIQYQVFSSLQSAITTQIQNSSSTLKHWNVAVFTESQAFGTPVPRGIPFVGAGV